MAKYLDIKLGKEIKLYRLNTGTKQDGNKWALFSYTPYEKNDKGDYIYGQEYTMFINNINDVNYQLNDGDKIVVDKILSVSAEDNYYKDKNGKEQHKRVIKVTIDIEIKGNNNNQNNIQQNEFDNQSSSQENDFSAISDGGYEFPNF